MPSNTYTRSFSAVFRLHFGLVLSFVNCTILHRRLASWNEANAIQNPRLANTNNHPFVCTHIYYLLRIRAFQSNSIFSNDSPIRLQNSPKQRQIDWILTFPSVFRIVCVCGNHKAVMACHIIARRELTEILMKSGCHFRVVCEAFGMNLPDKIVQFLSN